jgi:hypothetical protein
MFEWKETRWNEGNNGGGNRKEGKARRSTNVMGAESEQLLMVMTLTFGHVGRR